MQKFILLIFISLSITGCYPAQKVAKIDSATGLIQPKESKLGNATVVKKTSLPIEKYKDFVFFSATGYQYEFGFNQLKEIGYFNQIMKLSDLEKIVISNNLQDKVLSLSSPIGLSRLARQYHPFLWIKLSATHNTPDGSIAKIEVVNAENAEDVFVATAPLVSGSSDATVWYPLFNALIAWINENKQQQAVVFNQ